MHIHTNIKDKYIKALTAMNGHTNLLSTHAYKRIVVTGSDRKNILMDLSIGRSIYCCALYAKAVTDIYGNSKILRAHAFKRIVTAGSDRKNLLVVYKFMPTVTIRLIFM